jgi:endogenous inhibitor of DNA gyrase (YacG/DUF329 family)
MAGRPRKGADLDQKLKTYLDTYELDELNQANDLSSLRQLAQLELIIESIQKKLLELKDIEKNTRQAKDLGTYLKDTINSYTSLQTTLGIDRRKRASEAEESVQSYIERLQTQAKEFLEKRLKIIKCPTCNMPVAKYFIYSPLSGEPGSILAEKTTPKSLYHEFSVECPKCRKIVKVSNETKDPIK